MEYIQINRELATQVQEDIYPINIAIGVAKRSTCLDKQVGAIIVGAKKEIISTGYNGAPTKLAHCTDTKFCHKDAGRGCIAVHAEANALLRAGSKAEGSTIYITNSPCLECTKLIINAGIKRIVAYEKYSKHVDYSKLCPEFLLSLTEIEVVFLKDLLKVKLNS
jgi:dCMP deaminase